MENGLHEYLMDFLEHISRLGAEINRVFLVPSYQTVGELPPAAPPRAPATAPRAADALR